MSQQTNARPLVGATDSLIALMIAVAAVVWANQQRTPAVNRCIPAGLTTKRRRRWTMSLCRPLTIFIPHCSELLTDHRPHGDGLVCHALISRLAERGHQLYIAASADRPAERIAAWRSSVRSEGSSQAMVLRPGCITCGESASCSSPCR